MKKIISIALSVFFALSCAICTSFFVPQKDDEAPEFVTQSYSLNLPSDQYGYYLVDSQDDLEVIASAVNNGESHLEGCYFRQIADIVLEESVIIGYYADEIMTSAEVTLQGMLNEYGWLDDDNENNSGYAYLNGTDVTDDLVYFSGYYDGADKYGQRHKIVMMPNGYYDSRYADRTYYNWESGPNSIFGNVVNAVIRNLEVVVYDQGNLYNDSAEYWENQMAIGAMASVAETDVGSDWLPDENETGKHYCDFAVGGIAMQAWGSRFTDCRSKIISDFSGAFPNDSDYPNIYGEGIFALGGIVGWADSCLIEYCIADVKQALNLWYGSFNIVGGIVGIARRSTVRNCVNYGTVISSDVAGGIAGAISHGTWVDGCSSSATNIKVSTDDFYDEYGMYFVNDAFISGSICGGVVGYMTGDYNSNYFYVNPDEFRPYSAQVEMFMKAAEQWVSLTDSERPSWVTNCYNHLDIFGHGGTRSGLIDTYDLKMCSIGGVVGTVASGVVQYVYNIGRIHYGSNAKERLLSDFVSTFQYAGDSPDQRANFWQYLWENYEGGLIEAGIDDGCTVGGVVGREWYGDYYGGAGAYLSNCFWVYDQDNDPGYLLSMASGDGAVWDYATAICLDELSTSLTEEVDNCMRNAIFQGDAGVGDGSYGSWCWRENLYGMDTSSVTYNVFPYLDWQIQTILFDIAKDNASFSDSNDPFGIGSMGFLTYDDFSLFFDNLGSDVSELSYGYGWCYFEEKQCYILQKQAIYGETLQMIPFPNYVNISDTLYFAGWQLVCGARSHALYAEEGQPYLNLMLCQDTILLSGGEVWYPIEFSDASPDLVFAQKWVEFSQIDATYTLNDGEYTALVPFEGDTSYEPDRWMSISGVTHKFLGNKTAPGQIPPDFESGTDMYFYNDITHIEVELWEIYDLYTLFDGSSGILSVYVRFDANGGKFSDGSTVYSDRVSVGSSLGYLPESPTRSGYTFSGWGDFDAYTVINAPMTIYASWTKEATPEPTTANVYFYLNGGEGTKPSTQTVDIGATITLPTNNFTRAGFTANGWNKSSSLTATPAYASGSTVTINSNTSFYANWTPKAKSVKLSFLLNDENNEWSSGSNGLFSYKVSYYTTTLSGNTTTSSTTTISETTTLTMRAGQTIVIDSVQYSESFKYVGVYSDTEIKNTLPDLTASGSDSTSKTLADDTTDETYNVCLAYVGCELKYDTQLQYFYFEDGEMPQTAVVTYDTAFNELLTNQGYSSQFDSNGITFYTQEYTYNSSDDSAFSAYSGQRFLGFAMPTTRTVTLQEATASSLTYSSYTFEADKTYWFRFDPIRWRVSAYGVASTDVPTAWASNLVVSQFTVASDVLWWDAVDSRITKEVYESYWTELCALINDATTVNNDYAFDFSTSRPINYERWGGESSNVKSELDSDWSEDCANFAFLQDIEGYQSDLRCYASQLACVLGGKNQNEFVEYWTQDFGQQIGCGTYVTKSGTVLTNSYWNTAKGARLSICIGEGRFLGI